MSLDGIAAGLIGFTGFAVTLLVIIVLVILAVASLLAPIWIYQIRNEARRQIRLQVQILETMKRIEREARDQGAPPSRLFGPPS